MKKINLFSRLFILLVAVCAMSTNAWAKHDTHYGQVILTVESGKGSVYAEGQSGTTFNFNCGGDKDKDKPTFKLHATAATGYQFVKWYDDASSAWEYDNPYSAMPTATSKDASNPAKYYYKAYFEAIKYTLAWNYNGGTPSGSYTPAGQVAYETAITAPTMTQAGYNFTSWSPAFTGKMPNNNVTYTAQWDSLKYNLFVDYNGGKYGESTSLSIPSTNKPCLQSGSGNFCDIDWALPTRPGYTLTGIYDADNLLVYGADGICIKGTKYWGDNKAYRFPGDLNVKAQWDVNDYTITLDKNGGATNGSAKITFDTKTLQNFVPATKAFASVNGYYTAATGGLLVIDKKGILQKNVAGYTDADGNWVKAENTTLYAQWTNSHFEPQAFMADFNNPAKVDDTFTLNVKNVSDGLTGNFSATYNAEEFTITRAGNVITIKTIKAGVNSVTFEQKAVSSDLFAEKVTYTFDVTKYDNAINVTYTGSMYMASTQSITVAATANPAAILVNQTAGATIAGVNAALNTVTSYGNTGTATWKFSQGETYKYKAAEATMSITVSALPAASCNVLELDPNKKTFNDTKDSPYQLSGPGKTITFLMWKYAAGTSSANPHVKGSADGSGYGKVGDALSISVDETPKTVTMNNRTYRKLYVISDGQNNYKYVKNFQVTRDTYLETPASITIEKTAQDSFIFVGQTGTTTLKVDWSVCNGGDIYLQSTNPKFTLSENHITVTDGSDGTKNITVTYQSDEAGTFTGEIIAYNQVYRSVTAVTGITNKMYYATTYAEARPKIATSGKIYVSENLTEPTESTWVLGDKRDNSTNAYPRGVSPESSANVTSVFFAEAQTGYAFAGWYEDEECTVSAGTHDPADRNKLSIVVNTSETTKPGVEKTLYAKFTGLPYTVTFDPQGGTVDPTTSVVNYGSAYEAGTGGWPTPVKEAYIFAGWYTAADVKVEGTDIVNLTANTTLYAHWSAITYSVSFDKNGGNGEQMANAEGTYNADLVLPANTYTNTAFAVTFDEDGGSAVTDLQAARTFGGWEDRGSIVYKGTTWNYTDLDAPFYSNYYSDLYAAYQYNKYGLVDHYVLCGQPEGRIPVGSAPGLYPDQTTVKNLSTTQGYTVPLYAHWDTASVVLPATTKANCKFDGWYIGETKVGVAGDSYKPAADVELKAKWIDKTTPSYNYAGTDAYEVEDPSISLSTLWTSDGDGAITYTIESFVPATGEQTGATAPAIDASNNLSLGQAGTLTIKLTQAEGTDYSSGEDTQVITISRIANTLTVSPSTKEMKVGDEWTDVASNINSNGAITGETTDATLATYDATDNKIVATNTASKTLPLDVTVTVKQAQTYKYEAGEASTTITVGKSTTIDATPSATAIYYGQAVSASVLSNTGTTDGTWYWPDSIKDQVRDAGTYNNVGVHFVPTDAAKYAEIDGVVTLVVNTVDPTATASASAITYGQKVSASVLTNGAGSVAGTWTWPDSIKDQVRDAGTYNNVGVHFTPTSPNYNAIDGTVILVVNKANPDAAPSAADIIYGQKVKESVISNTGASSGAWAWDKDIAEDVKDAGIHPNLSVHFAPVDTVNYNKVDGFTALKVNKAQPTVEWTGATTFEWDTINNYFEASNGESVAMTSLNTAIAKIENNKIIPVAPGTVSIVGAIAESGNYLAAADTVELTINAPGVNTFTNDDKDGDWNNPNNWSDGIVPDKKDSIDIVVKGDLNITKEDSTILGSLTVVSPANVIVKDSAVLIITEPSGDATEYGDIIVENGGLLNTEAETKVKNFILETSIGTSEGKNKSAQVENAENLKIVAGAAFIDIYMDPTGTLDASQWYGFSLPFPVDVTTGVSLRKANGTIVPLTDKVGYAIYEYDMAKRLSSGKGWKEIHTTLQPGKFYYIGMNGKDNIYRFRKTDAGDLVAKDTLYLTTNGTGKDANWNAVGNPNLYYSKNVYPGYVQVYKNGVSAYMPIKADSVAYVVGAPFFVQPAADCFIAMDKATSVEPGKMYAPTRATVQEKTYKVQLLNNDNLEDQIYVSASEQAANYYETGIDFAKAGVSTYCGQIWVNAYGEKLAVNEAVMQDNNAEFALTLSAVKAGEYTLRAAEKGDGSLYLTKNGNIVWNLSKDDYVITLAKGQTSEYGLVLQRTSPTSLQSQKAGSQVEKFIKNEQMYILNNGRLYNANGAEVK